MNSFPTERTSYTQNFPFPENGEVIYENPPTLIWVPVDDAKSYTVKLYDEDKNLIEETATDLNYAIVKTVLNTGTYYWTVETDTGLKREMYSFTVAPNALLFERPSAKEVFDGVPNKRPRHLFLKDDAPKLMDEKSTEFAVLKNNVEMALKRELPPMPNYIEDPTALPYREFFGFYREVCDRDLVALATYHALTGDAESGIKAKEIFLYICTWDHDGICNVNSKYGDEIGLSNSRCLPSVYDMIYDVLNDEEKIIGAKTIATYAKQCKERIERIDYPRNPSDSHVGRLPGYLGDAALVLKGTGAESDETLVSWLKCALDIYCGIFPFYGGNDGSWAEGTFYSTSYTKWFLPFFSAVERFCGKSLMARPFYHRYTNYLAHFCNPRHEIHPFGDGYWMDDENEEFPGFYAQNPYRVYADKFPTSYAEKQKENLSDREYYKLHLLDLFLPATKVENSLAKEPENAEIFPDGGFAVLHTDINSSEDICILARASRFGSDSHRHADQGSFALFAGGVCLVSPSGYFGRKFGGKHHFEWANTSKAHNCLLFDGVGQPTFSKDSKGKIVSLDKENKKVTLDMSEAYPNISLWQREIRLTADGAEITDRVEAPKDVKVTYPLHFLSCPKEKDGMLSVERKGKSLNVKVIEGELKLTEITDRYDVDLNEGEPTEYHVERPTQYHAYYESDAKCVHTFKVKFTIK